MSLRDRQIGGIPLAWGNAFVLTFVLSLSVPVIAYSLWFPIFGIPEELRKWIALFGTCLYIFQCAGRVPAGMERAQLFFGIYTGESFPAGIYFLPRIPFPIISLLLELMFKEDVSKYLGWILEGDVSVESIVTSFISEGVTSDGIRVKLEGKLVFEIVNAAVFLSQRGNSSNKTSLDEAIQSEASSRIKERVIAKHTAQSLHQGSCEGGEGLNRWITESCVFVKDFGIRLSRSPIVTVDIKSSRIQKAFDAYGARDLMSNNTNALAKAFSEFRSALPEGTSEEAALMLFNAERIDEGEQPVSMNILKIK